MVITLEELIKNILDIVNSVIKKYRNLLESGRKCHKFMNKSISKNKVKNNYHKMMKMINKVINLI
jgi:hypothetical protein